MNRTNGPNKEDDEENASKVPGMTFDPARMQEMLNPAIMQQYTGHVRSAFIQASLAACADKQVDLQDAAESSDIRG